MSGHDCAIYPDVDVLDQLGESLEAGAAYPWPEIAFHPLTQDTGSQAWADLLQLVEDAARDQRTTFSPKQVLGPDRWSQIVTLPPSIGTLKKVRKLDLYRSSLTSIPPEIGGMAMLEEFVPYTSYSLHWFPFEITRCKQLRSSTVSTRALYGNYKYRPPFPRLNQPETLASLQATHCSVCNTELLPGAVRQVWISLGVATDVLPLLVNACSDQCIASLPRPHPDYVPYPHAGGLEVRQAAVEW